MQGVSFAVPPGRLAGLFGCTDDGERLEWIDALEADDDVERLDLDRDWEELHRALGDGELLLAEDGPAAAQAVLGAVPVLDDPDADVFAGLIEPDAVGAVAHGLAGFGEDTLRRRLGEVRKSVVPEGDDAIVDTFHELTAFLTRAAREGTAVVFTAM